MIKIDLHTHSCASRDGGITAEQYRQALGSKLVDVIAVTDHGEIDFAKKLQQEFGSDRVIVGQEILTREGAVIGLYLTDLILENQSLEDTIAEIHGQKGLVYIPCALSNDRHSVDRVHLEAIRYHVDILESANGRLPHHGFDQDAYTWANLRNMTTVASSDAHRSEALGKTYTVISGLPTKETLISLLKAGKTYYSPPAYADTIAPVINKFKRFFK